jgi:hypothetical protein
MLQCCAFAHRYDSVYRSEQKQNSLLDLIKTLHDDTGVASLLFTLTNRIPQLLGYASLRRPHRPRPPVLV